MILRGIIDRSLSSIVCIRGFAQLSDLERISQANNDYQRDIIPSHLSDIAKFLTNSEYKYFPEITLSYTLNSSYDNATLPNAATEVLELRAKRKSSIAFTKNVTLFKGRLDSRNKDRIETITINLDEALLNSGYKPFRRIDGNHRLAAVSNIKDEAVRRMSTPFCLILLNGDVADQKFESVIFHNINSKSEHLTSEENLKGILNTDFFSDEELFKNFSWTYVKARELIKKLDFDLLSAIKISFTNPYNTSQLRVRTVAVNALEFLKTKKVIKKSVSLAALIKAVNSVNSIYQSQIHLQTAADENLFIAFLYYEIQEQNGSSQLSAFSKWVVDNQIYKIRLESPDGVIEIFNKLLEKEIRVFMAMPYYSATAVDRYNESLLTAITHIKTENPHLNLTMYSIMRERGASMDIVHNLLNNISNCDIFIADITGNNENVFFEYGYAHSLSKKILLVKKDSDLVKVPFDVEHNLRMTYKGVNGKSGLTLLLKDRLKQIIIQLGYITH